MYSVDLDVTLKKSQIVSKLLLKPILNSTTTVCAGADDSVLLPSAMVSLYGFEQCRCCPRYNRIPPGSGSPPDSPGSDVDHCIRSTIVVMLIMQLGKLMGGSFERIVALSNAKATEFTTTIPVLVYKWFQGNKFSESTALGLFQSVIGVILVIASDRVAKKLGEDGLL